MDWVTLSNCVLGHGDCLDGLRQMPAASCDSLVTDPPAGIGFMGKDWDKDKGGRSSWIAATTPIARECLRVLKPGSHGVVWALPKTSHWTATALEDAGFEIRDVVTHHFGTGFPKSKSLLKPATEHWILVRTPGPLRELEIDACRIGFVSEEDRAESVNKNQHADHENGARENAVLGRDGRQRANYQPEGRWPANLVLSHSAECGEFGADCVEGCPVRALDEQSGITKSSGGGGVEEAGYSTPAGIYRKFGRREMPANIGKGDTGGASRFFYCAKPSTKERDAGLLKTDKRANIHPTVKSIELMTWLCKLVTPAGGTILDPFMGSGTTGCAALKNGFKFIGIEREPDYMPIARARIEHWSAQP